MPLSKLTPFLFLLPLLHGSVLTLSNFQQSGGVFSFGGQEPCLSVVFACHNDLLPSEIQITLPISGSASLSSNATDRQVIDATASVDYSTAPGWTVTWFTLHGAVYDDGPLAREDVRMIAPAPCLLDVSGNSYPEASCGPLATSSGTITVSMLLSADARVYGHGSTGNINGLTVTLTLVDPPAVGAPEPGTWGLMLAGLAASAVKVRARSE